MRALSPTKVDGASSDARATRLLVARFALALEPYMNDAAMDVHSLRQEEQVAKGIGLEAMEPVSAALSMFGARGETETTLEGRGGVASKGLVGEQDQPVPILDRFLASVPQTIPSSTWPENLVASPTNLDLGKVEFGGHREIAWPQSELVGMATGPGLLPGPIGGDAIAGESVPSAASSLGLLGNLPGLSQQGDVPLPGSLAMNDMLEQLREGGHSLTDPASLFPWVNDPPSEFTPPPVGRGRGDSWDPGWMSTSTAAGSWGPASMGEDRLRAGTTGRETGAETGLNSMAGETISELASCMLAATGRLEDAAQRLVAAAPHALAPPPRRFQGRVNG